MMNRILKRPMFRMGGRSDDGIMSVRRGYQEGGNTEDTRSGIEKFLGVPPPNETRAEAEKRLYGYDTLGQTIDTTGRNIIGYSADAAGNFIANPLINAFNFITGTDFETSPYNTKQLLLDRASNTVRDKEGNIISTNEKEEKDINKIPVPTKKKKVPQDPEKELLDIYKENKGVIDEIMGNSDESTKRDLYLQLARFGAGLAAQPGGDLVGAIGRAAEKPLEGVGELLADKRKTEKDIKTLALQKSFEDMKEPEQIKFVKAIQKEYGLDTFGEAYDLVTKSKKSSAQVNADNTYYRETGKNLGVSPEGFRREMDKLDDNDLGYLIGELTRPDAALPEDIDDRINGEYYVRPNGKAVRSVDGKLYEIGDPEFTAEITTKKA
jgi:hypothetical protein